MKMEIRGVADVNKVLQTIAPREAINLMRATVQGVASQVAKDAKANAPKDDGDLRKAIKVKRERGDRETLYSTVRVGRKAFYWRFLEYGDGPDGVEHAFFLRALQKLKVNIDQEYTRIFVAKLEARLKRLAKK